MGRDATNGGGLARWQTLFAQAYLEKVPSRNLTHNIQYLHNGNTSVLIPSNSCTILAAASPSLRSSTSGLAASSLPFGTLALHCSGLCKCFAYLSATKKLHIHSELMIPMNSASSPCSSQGQHPLQVPDIQMGVSLLHDYQQVCCLWAIFHAQSLWRGNPAIMPPLCKGALCTHCEFQHSCSQQRSVQTK